MDENNISRLLNLKKLNNTRDLGGIRTSDGHTIRSGRLIRSGQLFFADPQDIEDLRDMNIRKIIDFRSTREIEEKPDPKVGDAQNLHIPIIPDIAAGVSRDEESDEMAFDMIIKNAVEDPAFAVHYMEKTYLKMVQDAFSVSQYARFLDEISEMTDGAVLWHCTAGKDRAGFATVLLLQILGVPKEDIIADYLYTNICIRDEIEMILVMLRQKMDIGGTEDIIRGFFSAKEEYLLTLYQYMDEKYGGADTFLRDAMGVDEEKKQKIRQEFLI